MPEVRCPSDPRDQTGRVSEGGASLHFRRGQPRDERATIALARYERHAGVPLVLSAVLPIVMAPQQGNPVSVAIGLASWVVFVIDFVVHARHLENYLGTRLGKFDLAIVILTAPWFLLPGAQGGSIVVILRLARLSRLLVATRGARRLFERLGRVAIVAASVLVVGAAVAYYAEHPTNPLYATYWDSLWWATVTMTTVGYGDIYPITRAGRFDATVIMLTGVAILGLLAGTLASFFGLQPEDPDDSAQATPGPDVGADSADPAGLAQVLDELALLRVEVSQLRSALGSETPPAQADPGT
jgi:voltage-gated potassium channel